MIVKFRGEKINVCERLGLEDSIMFTENVANSVVDMESGFYFPAWYETKLIGTFMVYYTDIGKELDENERYNLIKDFSNNAVKYKKFIKKVTKKHIFSKKKFDRKHYDYLLDNINKSIEFKKNILIHRDSEIKDYVVDLLRKQIESQDLQNEILTEQNEINKKFTKEELAAMVNSINSFNKNIKNGDYIKAVAETVHELKD